MSSTIKQWYYDKKLGIDTSIDSDSHIITQGIYGDSVKYEPTAYDTIQKVIDYLRLNKDDVFVDFGCGKGRVIFSIATQKIKKVIGIELDEKLVTIAKANLRNLKLQNTPIEILNIDATNFDPKEGTIFFMFHPFGEKTLKIAINNIKNSLNAYPRKIRIVYNNPDCSSILDTQDWLVAGPEKGISPIPSLVSDGSGHTRLKISEWHNKFP